MPHDRNGVELQPGDQVMIPATVEDVQAQAEYCNVTVKLLPRCPDGLQDKVILNTQQVEKVEA